MINLNKSTHLPVFTQIAGVMPNDANIEFVGNRTTKRVIWLQHGSSHYFTDLPLKYFKLLHNAYLKDFKAQRFLQKVTTNINMQVELFTYYMYGDLDGSPDIANGKLGPSENFRDKTNCPSLLWNSKNINIGAHILTPRQLVIVDLIAQDVPNKNIAITLGISITTLDYHLSKLYKAVRVKTRTGLLKKAMDFKIV